MLPRSRPWPYPARVIAAETTTAEWITAWGAVITGVAAIAGLIVSILTARRANEEARDARTALGLVGKPTLQGGISRQLSGTPHMTASIWNVTDRPAVDVKAEITLANGSTWHGQIERLDQNTGGDQAAVREPRLTIHCGPMLPESRPGIETIVVRYRDERELLRWQWTRRDIRTEEQRGGMTLSSGRTETEEVRLERRRGRWAPASRT